MSTAAISYGTSTALTASLASLASDTNLLVGRTTNAIDNTSTLAVDYSVYFRVTTGTTPTTLRVIEIWAAGSEDGTNYAGDNGGTDAGKTHTAETKACMTLIASIGTNGSSDIGYRIVVPSLAAALGGAIPRKVSFFIVHNTGVNLNATGGNQVVTYTATKYTSA